MQTEVKARALAFYLPQFYPTPYNDEWWGKGFTEWTNTTKATPRFPGHYQPHLPADLGFYDLRLIDVMYEQAELMKTHAVHGFAFYHYWFSGRRILERPVDQLLERRDLEIPFMLCWANQNWARNWDGGFHKVLLEQTYSHEDDLRHIQHLIRYFSDERYIKIDGKPVFIVYRTELFPDIQRTAEIWRQEVLRAGFSGLYLINVENMTSGVHPESIGFDAGLDFHPKGRSLPERVRPDLWSLGLHHLRIRESALMKNSVWRYEAYARHNVLAPNPPYKIYPSLFPMWDNSSRREQGAWIFHGSTPQQFERWLVETAKNFRPYSPAENFIFINAWNEWAEGNHLEPDLLWGKKYLEVVKRNFGNSSSMPAGIDSQPGKP
jgi:lipopolysaccharide biosynthesis protein